MKKIDVWYYPDTGNRRAKRTRVAIPLRGQWTFWPAKAWHTAIREACADAGLQTDNFHIKLGDTRARSERPIMIMRVTQRCIEAGISRYIASDAMDARVHGMLERQRKQIAA